MQYILDDKLELIKDTNYQNISINTSDASKNKFGPRKEEVAIYERQSRYQQSRYQQRKSKYQRIRERKDEIMNKVDEQVSNMNKMDRFSQTNQINKMKHVRQQRYSEKGYDGEWEYIPPQGYKINTEISKELLKEYKEKFKKYLHIICKNSDTLPMDCNILLQRMLNISIRHSFSSLEVNTFAQRIEYLANIIPQRMPYLFIQLIHDKTI